MKKTSKFLAILLVVAMMASLCTAFAMDKGQHKQFKTYTCIGDSIAAGYTVDGIGETVAFERVDGAYHDLLANMVDANLNQLGCSAFRTVELRYMIDGVYTDDDGLWGMVWGKHTFSTETLDAYLTDMFKKAIAESDLVTINLGSNDIMSYTYITALIAMSEDSSIPGMDKIKENLAKTGDLGAALLKMVEAAESVNKLPKILNAVNKALEKSLNQFKDNWKASIDGILGEGGINPDTILCAVGAYNPGDHIYLGSSNQIDLAPILRPVVTQINNYMKTFVRQYPGHYYFADMVGVETFDVAIGDPEFQAYFTWASHPTRKGHMEMANRIYAALPDHWMSHEFGTQPEDVTVAAGENAAFTAQVAKANYPHYKWQSAPAGSSEWADIDGASTRKLTLSAVTEEMDGLQVRCVCNMTCDADGNQEILYSEPAVLHVKSGTEPTTTEPTGTEPTTTEPTTTEPTTTEPTTTEPTTTEPTTTEPTTTEPTTTEPTTTEPTGTEPAAQFPFVDVTKEGNWSYDDIYYVWEHGLMNGMTPTTFEPKATTTRGMFATVLYRMAGSPEVTEAQKKACPFTDLTADWYQDAVVWAYDAKVVNGVSEKEFAPGQEITREQLVAMLYRFSGAKDGGDPSKITDAGTISEYAKPAVGWAVANGIVAGFPDGSFQPQGNATREQMAAIIARFDRMGK